MNDTDERKASFVMKLHFVLVLMWRLECALGSLFHGIRSCDRYMYTELFAP